MGVVIINMQKKSIGKKVLVMYGGPGGEHEVSLRSGENVFSALNVSGGANSENKYEIEKLLLPKNFRKFRQADLDKWRQEKVLVLPIMHGKFGEGGEVQSVLEKNKIKFIGCGSKVSKVCIDKFATQKVLIKNKILTPKTWVIKNIKDINKIRTEESPSLMGRDLGRGFIVKQNDGGSSVDLFKVKTKIELERAAKILLKKYKTCLVQEFVKGREFTCGVIQNRKKIQALPVTEIVLTKGELFDYEAKYSVGGCEEITPAKIDDKLRQKIQTIAKKVFKVLGCRDLGRVDMIVDKKGHIFVLEINTMPGMTETSLIPQQLVANNMTTGQFLDIMIANER